MTEEAAVSGWSAPPAPAPPTRSRYAWTLLPIVCVWAAVQTPAGQSSIHPFWLTLLHSAIHVCMLTMGGAIAGPCVPEPTVAVVGESGAGLSAGVVPSACT